jgi:hypothetical protein
MPFLFFVAIFILQETILLIDYETQPIKAQFDISSFILCQGVETFTLERDQIRLGTKPAKKTGGFLEFVFTVTTMRGRDRETTKNRRREKGICDG